MRLAPPIYRSISDFRLAAPALCSAFYRPGLSAHPGLSDSGCSELASPASGLPRHPKVTLPGTALLSVAFRRLSPVDRPLLSRMQRGDLRHRSLCCDLPVGIHSRHLLPVAPWLEPFPAPASFPSPATKIAVTCSARTEPATPHSACAECTVRPDALQLVSARYHAVVSASHCCCLTPQTDSL